MLSSGKDLLPVAYTEFKTWTVLPKSNLPIKKIAWGRAPVLGLLP